MSDIDTEWVDGLKALDPERPIREADIQLSDQRIRPIMEYLARLGQNHVHALLEGLVHPAKHICDAALHEPQARLVLVI